jgi:hypothetical protein
MKTPTPLFLAAILCLLYACGEQSTNKSEPPKTVSIQDVRSQGFKLYSEQETEGFAKGDVYVKHVLAQGSGANARHDTLDLYDIHCIALYEGKLRNYTLSFNDTVFYDKAAYKWFGDSVVSVRLENSVSNKKSGNMNLRPGDFDLQFDYGKYEW